VGAALYFNVQDLAEDEKALYKEGGD